MCDVSNEGSRKGHGTKSTLARPRTSPRRCAGHHKASLNIRSNCIAFSLSRVCWSDITCWAVITDPLACALLSCSTKALISCQIRICWCAVALQYYRYLHNVPQSCAYGRLRSRRRNLIAKLNDSQSTRLRLIKNVPVHLG